jgi:tripartite-type tricarboxylate transporter receptor subunit TctC
MIDSCMMVFSAWRDCAAAADHAPQFTMHCIAPMTKTTPIAAGGSADLLGRIVAGKLGESLGQSVNVEMRRDAGGVLGSELVAHRFPDPVKDFSRVALFGGPPSVLAVHPSLPVRDLKSFVAFAKSRPRELTYGSPGNGTQGHLIAACSNAKRKSTCSILPIAAPAARWSTWWQDARTAYPPPSPPPARAD